MGQGSAAVSRQANVANGTPRPSLTPNLRSCPAHDPVNWQAASLMMLSLLLGFTKQTTFCYLLLLLLPSSLFFLLITITRLLLLLQFLSMISWHWPATGRRVGGPSGPNHETTILIAERRCCLGTIVVASPNFFHPPFHFFQHECANVLILVGYRTMSLL